MGWLKNLRSLDQKFSWSFLGFAFGILFSLFGIYTTFFYSRRPGFDVEILSQGPLYSIRENVSRLDIVLDGESIRQKKQMLSLLNLRVVNSGNSDISKGSYDEEFLPRFKVLNGRIVTIEPTGASNDYLRQYGKVTPLSGSEAVFAPVILEPDQSFSFKVLILHSDTVQPGIELAGKVAGVSELHLSRSAPPTDQPFWAKALFGDLVVQVTRLVVYLLGGIFAIVLLATSGSSFASWREMRRRAKYARRFKVGIGYELSKKEVALLDRYKERGESFVTAVCDLLRDSEALNSAISEAATVKEAIPSAKDVIRVEHSGIIREVAGRRWSNRRVIRFLLDAGIVKTVETKTTVDAQAFDFINRFESYLLALIPQRIKRHRVSPVSEEAGSGDIAPSVPPPATPET